MFKVPEDNRFFSNTHPMSTTKADGNNGVFFIPHYRIKDYIFQVIASDGKGWEHVSVQVMHRKGSSTRCCTWEEMSWIKDLFWDENDTVVQYHPPKKEYVNNAEFVLHLWRPVGKHLPRPKSILVGIKTNK